MANHQTPKLIKFPWGGMTRIDQIQALNSHHDPMRGALRSASSYQIEIVIVGDNNDTVRCKSPWITGDKKREWTALLEEAWEKGLETAEDQSPGPQNGPRS